MARKKVNLLPAELGKKEKTSWRKQLRKVGLVVPVAVIFAAYGFFYYHYHGQKAQLAQVEQELTSYQKIIGELEKTKQENQALEKVRDFVEQERANRVLWSRVMTDIEEHTGPDLVIMDLYFQDNLTVTVKGSAMDFPVLADFYLSLLEIPYLRDITIQLASFNDTANNAMPLSFTIVGQLRKGAGHENNNAVPQ